MKIESLATWGSRPQTHFKINFEQRDKYRKNWTYPSNLTNCDQLLEKM